MVSFLRSSTSFRQISSGRRFIQSTTKLFQTNKINDNEYRNYKGELQEIYQKQRMTLPTIEYLLNDINIGFQCLITINNQRFISDICVKKKAAEAHACRLVLEAYKVGAIAIGDKYTTDYTDTTGSTTLSSSEREQMIYNQLSHSTTSLTSSSIHSNTGSYTSFTPSMIRDMLIESKLYSDNLTPDSETHIKQLLIKHICNIINIRDNKPRYYDLFKKLGDTYVKLFSSELLLYSILNTGTGTGFDAGLGYDFFLPPERFFPTAFAYDSDMYGENTRLAYILEYIVCDDFTLSSMINNTLSIHSKGDLLEAVFYSSLLALDSGGAGTGVGTGVEVGTAVGAGVGSDRERRREMALYLIYVIFSGKGAGRDI